MRKLNQMIKFLVIPVAMISTFALNSINASAESESLSGPGKIKFSGEYPQDIVDPEKPGEIVDPGETPQLKGDLRIDFVPKLDFYQNKISDKDEIYYGNAQNFFGATKPRGNFVQVTDLRQKPTGWTLQLRQEMQFTNKDTEHSEIKGAMLSLDKSWVNSTKDLSNAPQLSKEIINIDNVGASYNLAQANTGQGGGTWTISFGASVENQSNQKNTLEPRLDKNGQAVLDPVFDNKPIYLNKAVSLSIPGTTIVDPVPYTTVLTWVLAELP
ncbi:WxL domain-containing protein [Enterococcus crotali]|uniref:WxL domain-containing protein n=1 Tax=Enterococcus crotali TaxID=1453587 RepID=UPI00046FC09F|nr:WxL domain-containing protein [Enterococcus crotali]